MKAMPHYQSLIQEEFSKRIEKNPKYSLRAFARALGISAATVSQIISGKRIPSIKAARKISEKLFLNPDEEQSFMASLAETHRGRGLERLSPIFRLNKNNPKPQELSVEYFRVIADWYHHAIMELTYVEDFSSDPNWIAKELEITPMEASLAIERLLKLELLEEKNGKLIKTLGHTTTANKNISTPALRKNQKQILEKAVFSLENDPIEKRNMTGMVMAIDPSKLPEAKKMIEEFSNTLCTFLETGNRKQVYQMGICLYPLQRKIKGEKHA